ncbi:MAG TPA: DUF817 domain-containing protein [Candidatus Angelobacter sp.]|jgi:uncharacterized membrane protein YoaT (DUF817 family)
MDDLSRLPVNSPNPVSAHGIGDSIQHWLSRAVGARVAEGVFEFLVFGVKQAAACVFAGSFLFLLAISSHVHIPGLARYDFLFLSAIAIQIVLVAVRLENWREVAVLSVFHLIGMGLELFKTSPSIRSWSYPEHAFFHIRTVPLYSGFMYASVASYIMQAWRLMQVRLTAFPPFPLAVGLCAAIYANFFTNHYIVDVRWPLAAAVLVLFRRTWVHFTVISKVRRMPLALSFLLIGFFIWVAENIATYFGAWQYPHQKKQWAIVGPTKISSWMLLVIISFIIVAALKEIFPKRQEVFSASDEPLSAPTAEAEAEDTAIA